MQTCELSLTSETLDKDQLQRLTRETAQQLNDGFLAELKLVEGPPGNKAGEVISLGQIVLTFIASGAALALINALRPVFDRTASLIVKIKRPDGAELELNAERVRSNQMLTMLREFLRIDL